MLHGEIVQPDPSVGRGAAIRANDVHYYCLFGSVGNADQVAALRYAVGPCCVPVDQACSEEHIGFGVPGRHPKSRTERSEYRGSGARSEATSEATENPT